MYKSKFNTLKNFTNYTKTETTNYTNSQRNNTTLPNLGRPSKISLNSPEYYQRKLYENTDYRLNCSPPIYYYRKITKPYKISLEREPSKYSIKPSTENLVINRLKNIINDNFGNFENFINHNERFKKDKFKPEGYLFYDWIVKHPKCLNGDLLASKFIHPNRKKIPTYEEIKHKYHHSDIMEEYDYGNNNNNTIENDNNFNALTEGNNENNTIEENDKNKAKTFYNNIQSEKIPQTKQLQDIYKNTSSDIFNLNPNTKLNISKSGEKYLQTEQENKNKIHFNKTVSNSEWYPKIPKRHNYMGYTSVKFNIISPGTKSFSLTKDDIIKGDKPSNKVKSISEFIDLCRVSAPNIGKNHENYLKENKSFGMKNGPGSNYLDMHKNYKELINKPF